MGFINSYLYKHLNDGRTQSQSSFLIFRFKNCRAQSPHTAHLATPQGGLILVSRAFDPIIQEDLCLFVCMSDKKSFTGKLFKLTNSEISFSAEKHAGNLKILTAAQRAGISSS